MFDLNSLIAAPSRFEPLVGTEVSDRSLDVRQADQEFDNPLEEKERDERQFEAVLAAFLVTSGPSNAPEVPKPLPETNGSQLLPSQSNPGGQKAHGEVDGISNRDQRSASVLPVVSAASALTPDPLLEQFLGTLASTDTAKTSASLLNDDLHKKGLGADSELVSAGATTISDVAPVLAKSDLPAGTGNAEPPSPPTPQGPGLMPQEGAANGGVPANPARPTQTVTPLVREALRTPTLRGEASDESQSIATQITKLTSIFDGATGTFADAPATQLLPTAVAEQENLVTPTPSRVASAEGSLDAPRQLAHETENPQHELQRPDDTNRRFGSVPPADLAYRAESRGEPASGGPTLSIQATERGPRLVDDPFVRDISSGRGEIAIAATKGSENQMSLQLDSPDLGTVWVSLKEIHGHVQAAIETNSGRAYDQLLQHLQALKTHIEQAGIELANLQLGWRSGDSPSSRPETADTTESSTRARGASGSSSAIRGRWSAVGAETHLVNVFA